jgi:hypothetical protein
MVSLNLLVSMNYPVQNGGQQTYVSSPIANKAKIEATI